MRKFAAVLLLACFAPLCAAQPAIASNEALAELMAEDQADRMAGSEKRPWNEIAARDADRRVKALEILRQGQLRTEADFHNAALIFQHGETAQDIQLAFALATIAAQIDPKAKGSKWLSAAAFDRLMMRNKKPQWYGTQYVRSEGSGKWSLYEIDESVVTDEQRKAMNVPSLDEAKAFVQKLNP